MKWYLCTNVDSRVIHNKQKIETTQVSIIRQMDKQNVVLYTYNGILFRQKRKEIMIHAARWINLGNIMLSEISQTQKDKYGMILLIRDTYRDRKENRGYQGLEGGKDI